MAKANKFVKNDEGVSAVIGVILMVAITVILAAVIAAFVFQLGSNVPKNKQVGVECKRVNNAIIAVKTMSGADVGQLKTGGTGGSQLAERTYKVVVNGVDVDPCTSTSSSATPTGTDCYNAASIGAVLYFPAGPNADVTVVAQFQDNTESPVWAGNLP